MFVQTYELVRRRVDSELGRKGKLSVSRIKLLMILDAEGPTRSGSLAAKLGLAPRSVTDAVDSLQREGFVERRQDPDDRRASLIFATRSGTRALNDAETTRRRVMDEIFSALVPEKCAQLISLLTTVREPLEGSS